MSPEKGTQFLDWDLSFIWVSQLDVLLTSKTAFYPLLRSSTSNYDCHAWLLTWNMWPLTWFLLLSSLHVVYMLSSQEMLHLLWQQPSITIIIMLLSFIIIYLPVLTTELLIIIIFTQGWTGQLLLQVLLLRLQVQQDLLQLVIIMGLMSQFERNVNRIPSIKPLSWRRNFYSMLMSQNKKDGNSRGILIWLRDRSRFGFKIDGWSPRKRVKGRQPNTTTTTVTIINSTIITIKFNERKKMMMMREKKKQETLSFLHSFHSCFTENSWLSSSSWFITFLIWLNF